METIIFNSNSTKKLQLLIDLAKELGIKTKRLSKEELEDAGMLNAINEGRTGEVINKAEFLQKLKK